MREQSTFLGRKASSSNQTNVGKQSSSCKESNSTESISITQSNSSKVTEDEQNEQLYDSLFKLVKRSEESKRDELYGQRRYDGLTRIPYPLTPATC